MPYTVTATTVADFRAYYPEFSDDTVWTDATLTRHLEAGAQEAGSTRWGSYKASPASLLARGIYAYAAHRAVLANAAAKAVAAGGAPSAANQVTSKSVGDESASYAVATPGSMSEQAAYGDLASTMYGQEFLRLRRRAGTGMAVTNASHL